MSDSGLRSMSVSRFQRFFSFIAASLVIAALSGFVSAQVDEGDQKANGTPSNQIAGVSTIGSSGNYRIGVGDVIKIVESRQERLSVNGVRVNNEGEITLPMGIGQVQAVCHTETELAEVIAQKYEKFLLDPQVYVVVEQFNSNPVAFIGAVNKPGRFDVRRPTRLLELLTFVNGPSGNAGDNVQIVRRYDIEMCDGTDFVRPERNENQEILTISLQSTLKGDDSANPYVQAGDIISIPEATAAPEAYIIGNVKSPKVIQLGNEVSLTRAIAMAGGTSEGAKIKKVQVTRQVGNSTEKQVIIANLEAIAKGEQDDIIIQPNDIVDVPGPKPSTFEKILQGLGLFRLPVLF